MFAIVEACGRQYQLEAGRFVDLDLHNVSTDDSFVFDKVLMIVDGANSTLGTPFVEGAKVTAKVLCHMKARKVIVYHQRPKKGTRKKQGHRAQYTRVLIDTIELKDKVLAKAEHQPKAEKAPKAEKKAEPKAQKTKAPAKAPAKAAKKEDKPAKAAKAEPKAKSTKKDK
jgi:large subunit ribosomal protein L21